jgi:hypothetical protein
MPLSEIAFYDGDGSTGGGGGKGSNYSSTEEAMNQSMNEQRF